MEFRLASAEIGLCSAGNTVIKKKFKNILNLKENVKVLRPVLFV